MTSINFNHLYYFWVVAKAGSMTLASRSLHVTQPTISAQIKQLEESLGNPLFRRDGKRLSLTEQGRLAFDYAEQIFRLGQEMTQALQGTMGRQNQELNVGVLDVLPKHLIYHFLQPALANSTGVCLRCVDGKLDQLLTELANHRLDLVLSDSPLFHNLAVKTQTHFLGESGLVVMGSRSLVASACGPTLAEKVQSLPVLLPTPNTAMRRLLDRWFDSQGLAPEIVGEFEDSGLLKVFAVQGYGLCFVPEILETSLNALYDLESLGRIDAGKARFYAITAERLLKHPVVERLTEIARIRLDDAEEHESRDE
jgi:LysR family transcriptional regulator, transcriptional activator of nhaA